MQADVLDSGPHNRQAAVLGGEHVNLIGALAHEALEAFDGIGRLNMAMHDGRKRVKREGLRFLFSQTSYGFRRAFAVFGECSLPIGRVPPVSSVVAKSPTVQLEPQHTLAWEWHSGPLRCLCTRQR